MIVFWILRGQKLKIHKTLKNLAKLFKEKGHTLYIVGGYVRDRLLGLDNTDIDITSNMPYEKVIHLCQENKIKVVPVNKTLGTLHIIMGDDVYEYTQFRVESYNIAGKHSPDEVEFVDDIKLDMLRRDITINSMYLDILNENIIDNCLGQKDLENKIIRTTNNPKITLNDDALRILRIIRFASILDFKIHKDTFKHIKIYLSHLKSISKEIILNELKQIVIADFKYKNPNKIFLNIFNKLNIYHLLFNYNLTRIRKISKKDIDKYFNLTKDARLIGFYILVLKNYLSGYTKNTQLQYDINCLLGRDGIKESNLNITLTNKLYLIYQNLEYQVDAINATVNYLTLSDTEREIVLAFLNEECKRALFDNIKTIKDNNLPISAHELPITPTDLIDNGIDRKYISKLMDILFNQVLQMKVKKEKEDLLNLALEIHKSFSQIEKKEK